MNDDGTDTEDLNPEPRQDGLDLREHTDGWWPSSKNITQ